MQTPKVRRGSSEAPVKASPPRAKAARKLKTLPDSDSPASSNQTTRTQKESIPVAAERRSPRGSVTELPKKSPGKVSQLEAKEKEWQAKFDTLQKHHSANFAALSSAMGEIQRLKSQLEIIAREAPGETEKSVGATVAVPKSLEENLEEAFLLVEDMKKQLKECKDSEVNAHASASQTLLQLGTARAAVEMLQLEGAKSAEACNALASELEFSKGRIKSLEELVGKLKFEVDVLRSAQETSVADHQEEQIQSTVQLRSATELVEQVRSEMTRSETNLEAELEAVKAQLENELKESKEAVADLKADLMDKETEFQNILEENETLKSELKKKEADLGKAELDAARAAEQEALTKLESVKEEADRSSKRASRVAEQLGAAQAANAEMEAELRKMKIQSDQWRKAAEVAASMLTDASPGSVTERNRANGSPCPEDRDEDALRKRNSNVLKKFVLSWKKSQK